MRDVTVKEAAVLAGISARRMRELAAAGQVVGARRVGSMWLIRLGRDGRPRRLGRPHRVGRPRAW